MLGDVFYYTSLGMIGIASSIGLISIVNPDLGKRIFWNAVKGYHYVRIELDKVKKGYDNIKLTTVKSEEMPILKNTYIGYKVSDGSEYSCKRLEEWYEYGEKFDLEIVIHKDDKDDECYKIVNDNNKIDNENFEKLEPIFIQVEIEQLGERTSIHDYLKPFYLDNNIVLDENFLKWYLNKFYGMVLNNEYTLHIIDNSINLFKINEKQKIYLYKVNNKLQYKIIN